MSSIPDRQIHQELSPSPGIGERAMSANDLARAFGNAALTLHTLPENHVLKAIVEPLTLMATSLLSQAQGEVDKKQETDRIVPDLAVLSKIVQDKNLTQKEEATNRAIHKRYSLDKFERLTNPLNEFQTQVLDLYSLGMGPVGIAERLSSNKYKVEKAKESILKQLKSENLAQATAKAVRKRWLPNSQLASGLPISKPHLTGRQKQIFELMMDGLDDKGVGKRLRISPGTVHAQLTKAFVSLGVYKSRPRAVRVAIETRALEPDEVSEIQAGEPLSQDETKVLSLISEGYSPSQISVKTGVGRTKIWQIQQCISTKLDTRHKDGVSPEAMSEAILIASVKGDLKIKQATVRQELSKKERVKLSNRAYSHQVLELLVEGYSREEISEQLEISPTSCSECITSLYHMFGVYTRPQLVVSSLSSGYVKVLPESERDNGKRVKARPIVSTLKERLEQSPKVTSKTLLTFLNHARDWKTYEQWADLIEPNSDVPLETRVINLRSRLKYKGDFKRELAQERMRIHRRRGIDEDGKKKLFLACAHYAFKTKYIDKSVKLSEVEPKSSPANPEYNRFRAVVEREVDEIVDWLFVKADRNPDAMKEKFIPITNPVALEFLVENNIISPEEFDEKTLELYGGVVAIALSLDKKLRNLLANLNIQDSVLDMVKKQVDFRLLKFDRSSGKQVA